MSLRAVFLTIAVLILSFAVNAKDFDWLNSLSLEAQASPDGFRTRLATRFNLGDAQVHAVIDNIGNHADAYMVLRLAEMSHHPVDYVSERYRSNKGKGWGVIAKSLGIKPGSKEFHALKAGHDLDTRGHSDGNEHGRGKGKGKDKHHGNPGRGHKD